MVLARNIHVSEITEDSIEIKWNEPDGSYDFIEINCMGQEETNNKTVTVFNGENPRGTCDGLTPGAVYSITVSTNLLGDPVDPVTTTLSPDTITGRYNNMLELYTGRGYG